MKTLDISYNRIAKVIHPQMEAEIRGIQISLDILRLDYNQIDSLMPGSFQHFYKVNKTYLSGNPLTNVMVSSRQSKKNPLRSINSSRIIDIRVFFSIVGRVLQRLENSGTLLY